MGGVFFHMIVDLQNTMTGICKLKSLGCQVKAQKASEVGIFMVWFQV